MDLRIPKDFYKPITQLEKEIVEDANKVKPIRYGNKRDPITNEIIEKLQALPVGEVVTYPKDIWNKMYNIFTRIHCKRIYPNPLAGKVFWKRQFESLDKGIIVRLK